MRMSRVGRIQSILGPLMGLLLAASCTVEVSPPIDPTEPDDGKPANWDPSKPTGECNVDALLQPFSYGAKVKTLITGLPLDNEELQALNADPAALQEQIDGWLQTPEADAVLERFFMTAFQQTSTDRASLFYLLGRNATTLGRFTQPTSPNTDEMLNANFAESFARTAAELVRQGKPFTEVLTTDTFMMTTAQMAFLAFSDDEVIDDEEGHDVRTTQGHFPTITLVKDVGDAPPAAQALDPQSPQFMTFWHQRLDGLPGTCNVAASQILPENYVAGDWRMSGSTSRSFFVWSMLMGRHQSVLRHQTAGCGSGAANREPLLTREDFSDWRMVKVTRLDKPNEVEKGEPATLFYDLPNLRSIGDSGEMKLYTPRIGFFTAPGFFSTWPNNEDNAARVTINQTLIVALGKSFEGDTVVDFSPKNINAEHADPETACYGCHQTLDPMRDYFRASFTNFYGEQLDEERTSLQADFVFGGVQEQGNGIYDLANVLVTHSEFPRAWVQKLCYYANSEACTEGAEFDRIAQAFVESNYNFRTLVKELFSSPLITGSECIDGVDAGTTATIARRSTFCNQLSHRVDIEDICGLRTHSRDATNLQNDVRDAVASVPDDAFSRAVVEPIVIAETGLFARANREAACVLAAQVGFDEAFDSGTPEFTPEGALLKMVTQVMGLPTADPRHTEALQILNDHVIEAMDTGKTELEALQSAYSLACMAPSSAGVGF